MLPTRQSLIVGALLHLQLACAGLSSSSLSPSSLAFMIESRQHRFEFIESRSVAQNPSNHVRHRVARHPGGPPLWRPAGRDPQPYTACRAVLKRRPPGLALCAAPGAHPRVERIIRYNREDVLPAGRLFAVPTMRDLS
ncbi:hypothetical protein Micbo1qcDRAFT_26842 [Microdochium bolleyi]|uniref:Secreted protein n=1 Tax=Microdochium bolleyi TaxID=196109 RepID=A0A136JE97_9PEZI|nr:hypothetical protein Micbo1qcDRAFT_26842 [Microdochium bolleyi]